MSCRPRWLSTLSSSPSPARLIFHKHVKWDNVFERTRPSIKFKYCHHYYHSSHFIPHYIAIAEPRCWSLSHFPCPLWLTFRRPSLCTHCASQTAPFLGEASMALCCFRPLCMLILASLPKHHPGPSLKAHLLRIKSSNDTLSLLSSEFLQHWALIQALLHLF